MKAFKKVFYTILLVVMVVMVAIAGNSHKRKNIVKGSLSGGVAKVNITPEKPMPMAGYSDRIGSFSGVHDSIFATALVFSEGDKKAVIITTDLIGLSHTFCKETLDLIEKETGIERGNILLTAAHNHGGPVTGAYKDTTDKGKLNYMGIVQQKIVQIIVLALQNLQPISIGYGKGTCSMNINRRARFADGSMWLGRNPEGSCDHDVSVVRVDDMNKKPIAVFINWPCHGTVGGSKNTQITGDWPGSTARYVEKVLGNNVIAAVTAGASGNINPIYGPNDKFEDIDAIGMLVGEEIVNVFNEIKTSSGGSISCIKKTVSGKGKKQYDSRFPNQELQSGNDVDINLSVLRVGDILIAGISGELFTEIGMDIKTKSALKNTIVVTHCNGNSGYLCTDEAYPLGGYEIMVTRTMPGTEGLIRENLLEMIHLVE